MHQMRSRLSQFGSRISATSSGAESFGIRMRASGWAQQSVAKGPALLVILGFALVVARLHEVYPPLSKFKPVLIAVLAATAMTISMKRPPGEKVVPTSSRTWQLLIGYIAWMTLTIPTSIYRSHSVEMVVGLVPLALFTTVVIAQRTSVPHLQYLTRGFLLVCAVYGVLLILVGKAMLDNGELRYYLSDSLDPNDAAAFLAMGAPMALASARRPNQGSWRLISWVSLGLICLAVVKTGSRGGFIALCAGLALVMLSSRGAKALITLGGVCAVLFLGWQLLPPEFTNRFTVIGDASADYNVTSYTGRVQIWKRGIRYFAQDPILGVGVGNFPTREGMQMADDGITGKWSEPHNAYVQAFAELGALGGILFIALLINAMRGVAPVFRTRSPVSGMAHPEYLAALGAFAVSSIFLSHAYFWGFFVLVGLCALAARTLSPEQTVIGARQNAR